MAISTVCLSLAAPSTAAPPRHAVLGGPCTITGTPGDDDLTGTAGDDVICGLGGDDRIEPLEGTDVVNGGPGSDLVAYPGAPGVAVDIAAGTASGEGDDQLLALEGAEGSPEDDQLRGDDGPNLLVGGEGVDLLFGRDGDDDLQGEGGGDYLHGGADNDSLSGGDGPDACRSGVATSCFLPDFADPGGTNGRLDIRQVHSGAANQPPRWTFVTEANWTNRVIWDRGYLLVFADTKGDPEADYHVLGYADGSKLRGALYRHTQDGSAVRVRGVTVKKKGPRSAVVRLPLAALDLARAYFRWSLMTLFTGPGCQNVCFDRAPGAIQLTQAIGSASG